MNHCRYCFAEIPEFDGDKPVMRRVLVGYDKSDPYRTVPVFEDQDQRKSLLFCGELHKRAATSTRRDVRDAAIAEFAIEDDTPPPMPGEGQESLL